MPSKRSEQTQPSAADDSCAQVVEATQDSAAVPDANELSDAASFSEQKQQRWKKQYEERG